MRNGYIEDVIHLLMGLAYGKAAHCVTVQIHIRDGFCVLDAD